MEPSPWVRDDNSGWRWYPQEIDSDPESHSLLEVSIEGAYPSTKGSNGALIAALKQIEDKVHRLVGHSQKWSTIVQVSSSASHEIAE